MSHKRDDESDEGTPPKQLAPVPVVRALLLTLILEHPDSTGYVLMRRIREFTGGRVELKTGTVYSELRRLEDQGLVTTTRESGGRQRRTYRITERGREELGIIVEEIQRRVNFVLRPLVELATEHLQQDL